MASLSLVIRTYNAASYWPALNRAISAQSRPPDELLVVDSESSDDTVTQARAAGARVVTITQAEFTHARSTNLGFREARGDWVAMLSQDALPQSPNWLERLAARLESEPGVAAAFSRQVPRDDCFPVEAWEIGRVYPDPGPAQVVYSNVGSLARKRCWEDVPFDESVTIAEDRFWALALMERGHRIAYVPDSVVIHSHDYSLRQMFARCREEARALRVQEGMTQGVNLLFKAWPKQSLRDGVRLAREGGLHRWPRTVAYRGAQFAGLWSGGRP